MEIHIDNKVLVGCTLVLSVIHMAQHLGYL